ncbi:MAG: hypothetical protein MUF87_21375 [Anaerolineae bacterium]|jgi:hypothetical protein|nr:hypothetical protein [Anaerolineae bacterium]
MFIAWIDPMFYLNIRPTLATVLDAVVAVFQVDAARVSMHQDNIDWTKIDKSTEIICEVIALPGGEFPTALNFVILEDTLIPTETLAVIGRFCEQLQCEAVIDHDWGAGEEPNRFILVRGLRQYQQVIVELDDHDAIKVIEYL